MRPSVTFRRGRKSTPNENYMGGAYEVTGSAVKKYYSVAGMIVAVNDGTGLQYLLTDHLGSTVAVTNQSGTLTSQQRYLPFGAPRTIPNSPIAGTDFTYTGQRKLDDGMGGIMDYKARFYSPALGRFLQPDTVIPDQTNPQSWNRLSYVRNNPILFNDPTGHVEQCDELCGRDNEPAGLTVPANSSDEDLDGGLKQKKPKEKNKVVCGQSEVYSSRCPGWHFYRTTNLVCPAYLHCTAAQMQDYLYRFVYPGQDPNDPVRNDAKNWVFVFGFLPLGQIQTQVNGLMITNVTQRNHLMYDGQVERRAVENSDGSWSIVTTGMGNNSQISFRPDPPLFYDPEFQQQHFDFSALNQGLGPGPFNDLDEAMLNDILEHQ